MKMYTAQVMIDKGSHKSKGSQYENGDIQDIYPFILAQHNLDSRLAFIHIINAPDDFLLINIRGELVRAVVNEESLKYEVLEKSAWYADTEKLKKTKIKKDKQIVIDWSVARDCFIRKSDDKSLGGFYDEIV